MTGKMRSKKTMTKQRKKETMTSTWIAGKTMLKKWRQTIEKQWKNCGFDGTSIESKYSQKTMESANETVDTVQRLGLVCRGPCISVLVKMCHALGTATRVSIDVFFGILWERRIEGV